ncbi:hypothetical protein CDAR_563871 [Caerostris darwini]|uniref:Uncharacterized protein n=1 Tax=Caerostris darwini TaxID=1538125 RepID=A0AAV4UZE4_9ARAC|nr:hypothetical protein CDAR_563871 [Caerostris darwini]
MIAIAWNPTEESQFYHQSKPSKKKKELQFRILAVAWMLLKHRNQSSTQQASCVRSGWPRNGTPFTSEMIATAWNPTEETQFYHQSKPSQKKRATPLHLKRTKQRPYCSRIERLLEGLPHSCPMGDGL